MLKSKIQKIMKQPSLAEQLPYHFRNGTSMQGIATTCSQCNAGITQENIRGALVEQNSLTVSFEGHGLCFECKTFSPLSARFNSDDTVRYLETGTWKHARFIRPAGMLRKAGERIAGFLRKLCGQV